VRVEIRHQEGAPWAQLVRIPSLAETCDVLDHAWVAATDLARAPP
jgi:hypothetical protein